MLEFFDAYRLWVCRYECGYFPWWLIAWLCATSISITISYIRIPIAIRRYKFIDLPILYYGFVAFIILCGIGHFVSDVMPFFYPHYILVACWSTATAIVSDWTARNMSSLLEEKRSYERLKKEIREIPEHPSETIEKLTARLNRIIEQ